MTDSLPPDHDAPAPGASLVFDRVADIYDHTRGGMRRGRRVAAELAPLLAYGPVLEVGVGTGLIALGLRELGYPVVGVDLSAPMLARAYDRVGPCLARADAQALPVRSASVGTVLFVHVLQLVGDLGATLAEAARVLRPGGRLVAVHGGPQMEPDDLVETTEPLRTLRDGRADALAVVVTAATAVGFGVVEQRLTAPFVVPTTPAELAASIADRQWSYLWRVDEATWRAEVEPVIAALRALPDQDRVRRQVGRTNLTVLAR